MTLILDDDIEPGTEFMIAFSQETFYDVHVSRIRDSSGDTYADNRPGQTGSFGASGMGGNLVVSVVPEPATLVLLGIGLTSIIVRRRKTIGN